jgi:8-oxo-dGTP pyrophosphatase MutT (NUDIX family)
MEKQAVYAIVFRQDQKEILLVQRRDLPVWVLPGGGLDADETPEEGTIREVEEETGLQVAIVRKIAEYLPVNKMTQKTHFFECSPLGGALSSGPEAKKVAFFPLEDLPLLPPPFSGWIADALSNYKIPMVKPIEGVTYWILIKLLLKHPLLVIRYFLTKIGIRFNSRS